MGRDPQPSVSQPPCYNDIIHIIALISLLGVPKLSSFAKAEDKLFRYLFGNYQKWVRPVEYLNQTIRVKFGLAISQLVDVVSGEKNMYF